MVPNETIDERFLSQTASFLPSVSSILQQQFPFPQSIFSSSACQVQCLVQWERPVGKWQRINHDFWNRRVIKSGVNNSNVINSSD
jgi:hypothetical protein